MNKNSIILGAGNHYWRVKRKTVTPKQFEFLLNNCRAFGISSHMVDDKAQLEKCYKTLPFNFETIPTVEV